MTDEPILGLEGDECRSCQATLAVDQRYCLNCGERRGETRVDLAALNGGSDGGVAEAGAAEPASAQPPGAWTPMAIVGGIATLAVVLLVGVMLGRGEDQSPVPVAAAPVAATTTTESSGENVAVATDEKQQAGGGKDSGGKGSGGKDKVVPAESTPGAETVTDDQLDALDQATGDDYAKQSKNLPDTIALPGEPPPKDNEEPGAGTDAQVIK